MSTTSPENELDACLAEAMAIIAKLNSLGRHSLETMDRHAKLVQRVERLKEKP